MLSRTASRAFLRSILARAVLHWRPFGNVGVTYEMLHPLREPLGEITSGAILTCGVTSAMLRPIREPLGEITGGALLAWFRASINRPGRCITTGGRGAPAAWHGIAAQILPRTRQRPAKVVDRSES